MLISLLMMVMVQTTGPATSSADPVVDHLLAALDERAGSLHSFVADVRMANIDPIVGSANTNIGKVFFEQVTPGDARIHADFTKREADGKTFDDHVEYTLADGKLIDRNYHSKIQITRQVTRPGEKIDLFRLGDGPFPLPIGQKPADVYANFSVRRVPADPINDPRNTIHVQLTPKPGTRLARKFKTIDVWVDTTSNMPMRIETLNTDESENRRTDLGDLKINVPLKESDLRPDDNKLEGWQVLEEAYEE